MSYSTKTFLIIFSLSSYWLAQGMNFNDPFRFGEIHIEMPLSQTQKQEIRHLMSQEKWDNEQRNRYLYEERRILVAKAIRAGYDPNKFILDAAFFNDYWLLKDLLEQGADSNYEEFYSIKTPIFLARSTVIAKLLIDHGANPTKTNIFGTILHQCNGDFYPPELMEYYVKECHLDVNYPGQSSYSIPPLHALLRNSNKCNEETLKKVKILIAAGARLDTKYKWEECYCTPLEIAKTRYIDQSFSTNAIRNELLTLLNPNNQSIPSRSNNFSSSSSQDIIIHADENLNNLLNSNNQRVHSSSSSSLSASSTTSSFLMEKRLHDNSESNSSSSQSSTTRENENMNENDCPICLETMHNQKTCFTYCAHRFHTQCIESWIETAKHCPLCRKRLISV